MRTQAITQQPDANHDGAARQAAITVLGALALVALATVCGLAANALSSHGVPLVEPTPSGEIRQLTLDQAIDAFERGDVFVDSRAPASYDAGHVAGAQSVPYADRRERSDTLRAAAGYDERLVVYCRGGDCEDARRLADWLSSQGWSRVAVLEDGYPLWQAAGLPIEGGEQR